MSIVNSSSTLADTLESLGHVSPDRIRMNPAPGTAIAADVQRIHRDEGRLFELVDGILVEKPAGFRESLVALTLANILSRFLDNNDLGVLVGADGMMRLFDDTVRIPDVAFLAWDRFPDGQIPTDPVPHLAPTIAVEVLSQSNTSAEMSRKRDEYARAGVTEVWEVELTHRTVTVYQGTSAFNSFSQTDVLTTNILPGFELRVSDLFAKLDREEKGLS